MAKTIMVVDDEPDNRETVRTILEKNGYKVIKAVNGDDCLKKLPKQKVDLILLDIMMPGMPTKEIVARIKGIKVVYLTAVGMSEAEKEDLLKVKNVVGLIRKPFDINDLLKEVSRFVG